MRIRVLLVFFVFSFFFMHDLNLFLVLPLNGGKKGPCFFCGNRSFRIEIHFHTLKTQHVSNCQHLVVPAGSKQCFSKSFKKILESDICLSNMSGYIEYFIWILNKALLQIFTHAGNSRFHSSCAGAKKVGLKTYFWGGNGFTALVKLIIAERCRLAMVRGSCYRLHRLVIRYKHNRNIKAFSLFLSVSGPLGLISVAQHLPKTDACASLI